jgi:SSS family solute:Na+ symporter
MNLTALDLAAIIVPFGVVLWVALALRRYMRSVADFLAASRCAGRYLICTAIGETGSSVMVMLTMLEVFSKTGFSLRFWEGFSGVILFFFGLLGLVVYRFRETRALTFHQFFEMRYSKGVRVLACFLHVFSGLFNFGVQPAVGARFFVYFCGLPESIPVYGMHLPTFIPVMLALMGVSLYFAMSGGQISVMITDCLEAVISSFFYLLIAIFIIFTLSTDQMRQALTSGTAGNSFLDPFDIGSRTDFNGWYILIGMVLSIYYFRGNAWTQGFAASAKSAHEGRMAQILGNWRGYSYSAMAVLAAIAAFTVLNHPDFAPQQAQVSTVIQDIGSSQLQTQMRMPIALGILFAPGVRGAFCAVLLFGLIASQGVQLHGYGSSILQDVILPLRKKHWEGHAHVRALQFTILFVAIFACTFSIIFKPVEYLVMITMLIGSIYLGGIGLVVWGGLYWKRGTTAAAYVSLIIGGVLGVAFNLMQQCWKSVQPVLVWIANFVGASGVTDYLRSATEKSPLNGVQLALIVAAVAGTGYVLVSLLTCRKPFDLDSILHRGAYAIPDDNPNAVPVMQNRSRLYRFLGIDEHFKRGDIVLTIVTFFYTITWKIVALAILLWVIFVGDLSTGWWFEYTMITGVWLALALGIITTFWFAFGVFRDIRTLFRELKAVRRDEMDNGTVEH